MSPDCCIYLIDDDEAVRSSLEFLLSSHGRRTQTFESAEAFLDAIGPGDKGCVVTDVRMPGMTGIDLIRRMKERGLALLPVIVITGHGDVPLAVEAMKAGAVDFIEKPFEDSRLLQALDNCAGDLSAESARAAERANVAQRLSTLSGRERDVLQGLVAGRANKVIAHELGISPRTVEIYRANLMTKMRARSLSELVRMALLAEQ